jgi:hypothetical protein
MEIQLVEKELAEAEVTLIEIRGRRNKEITSLRKFLDGQYQTKMYLNSKLPAEIRKVSLLDATKLYGVWQDDTRQTLDSLIIEVSQMEQKGKRLHKANQEHLLEKTTAPMLRAAEQQMVSLNVKLKSEPDLPIEAIHLFLKDAETSREILQKEENRYTKAVTRDEDTESLLLMAELAKSRLRRTLPSLRRKFPDVILDELRAQAKRLLRAPADESARALGELEPLQRLGEKITKKVGEARWRLMLVKPLCKKTVQLKSISEKIGDRITEFRSGTKERVENAITNRLTKGLDVKTMLPLVGKGLNSLVKLYRTPLTEEPFGPSLVDGTPMWSKGNGRRELVGTEAVLAQADFAKRFQLLRNASAQQQLAHALHPFCSERTALVVMDDIAEAARSASWLVSSYVRAARGPVVVRVPSKEARLFFEEELVRSLADMNLQQLVVGMAMEAPETTRDVQAQLKSLQAQYKVCVFDGEDDDDDDNDDDDGGKGKGKERKISTKSSSSTRRRGVEYTVHLFPQHLPRPPPYPGKSVVFFGPGWAAPDISVPKLIDVLGSRNPGRSMRHKFSSTMLSFSERSMVSEEIAGRAYVYEQHTKNLQPQMLFQSDDSLTAIATTITVMDRQAVMTTASAMPILQVAYGLSENKNMELMNNAREKRGYQDLTKEPTASLTRRLTEFEERDGMAVGSVARWDDLRAATAPDGRVAVLFWPHLKPCDRWWQADVRTDVLHLLRPPTSKEEYRSLILRFRPMTVVKYGKISKADYEKNLRVDDLLSTIRRFAVNKMLKSSSSSSSSSSSRKNVTKK